ncbi:zeta toxin family protein [Corynebacterium sp. YSMAA1_1_F7]|uniref:DNA polymerase III subunit beta family protein n=1 Tax=Corynebacterium sp. YSMAA1_1_F7 TaxID=3383590 RepID=UPI0038D17706
MARKPRVPKVPRIGGGGRKRGPLSVETKIKIARSLARVKGDTTDWDPYEKKGRAPGKGGSGSGAGKKTARMTTTTSKGGAKVTSGIDKRTGNKVTVSKTSGTAGKNRKNAKATANPFGDFPNNTVKGGGHQASKEYLTPDNIRTEPGFRSDLQAVADRLTTPAKTEKYLDRLDDRMVRAMEDTGSPAKNRHNQRAAIHNYTQARELGLIDAELNRTGKKPVMPSKDKLPDVKSGDPDGNAKRAKGINAPVAGGEAKQAPKMKATAGKRKPATVKGEKAGDKPAKAAKPTTKANKGTKGAKNGNTKPAKHPKVHGTYTPEEQAAERANPGRKGGIIDREAENLTPRQLNRLARYYGLDNEQKINQLGVDKGNKKFRHTPEFEKSYDKWLAKTVAPALDTLDPDGRVDRTNPDAVLEALGVGRKDGVDTRRALTSPIYFQTLSGDVRAAIAEHVGFVPSPVNMQRSNRGEKRPAVFAEAFAIQHRRQKAGELPKFAEDRKPVKRPKGKRKPPAPAKPKQAPAKNAAKSTEKTPAKPAEKRNNGITYRPADGDNMPAIGHHDGVTAKGTYITRPDGSSVRGDVKPVKVDTDPDYKGRYDTAGRYAQITSDGKHLIVANNESELDTMLRDYTNSRGEVGKLVADNGEAPERDLGLSDWKSGNRDRTYVNKWHEPAGFEFETYKNSGRPKWATIDGKGISNTRADKLRGGKVWVDNKTGELHVEAGNDELPADKIAERLAPELEKQLGRSITYQPKKGGNKPDVKPDAKPNAGAEKAANKAGNTEDDKAANIAALTPYLAAEPRHLAETPETINDPVQKAVDKAKAPERVAESVTDNRDMADRLLDLATARSRDETLPMLTGVNFDVNDGEATIAATDRFRLATEHVKIDAPNGKHLVDGNDFQAAMRAMKGVEGDFKLTDNNDGTYTLTRGDVSRNLKGIDSEFPVIAPLMPNLTEETPRFTVNAPALRKVALEAKRNRTRHGGLYFKPVDGKDAYHVSWTDKYGDVRTVDVPAKFSNDNSADRPAFAVNQTYLADILGGVKGDVTVGNDAGHRPLRIVTDGEEQPTRLLMPIRGDGPDMVAEPGVNNAARHHLNALYDALAAPKENRVAYNAKELRAAIKNAYEQATKDVKEGTPEYFLHATPDGRMRVVAGNKKSGVKVYGEVAIEPGQAEMFAILPHRNAKGAPAKPGTLNAPFKGDNGVFTVHEGKYALNHTEHGTTGQMNYVVGKESLQRTRTNLRKFGYNPDQGDGNNGTSPLPGLNDVSKFDADAAAKRAEKMELDRTRRELAEVGMTDVEKTTAATKRDNMPRLDGQNGLRAKTPEAERRDRLSGDGAPLDAGKGYQERGRWVEQTMKAMISRDGDSQARYSTVKADGTREYSPERRAQHAEIIGRLIAEAEADGPVPRDRKALFTGGIGGSGKGATLKERNKGESTKYLTLNADDVKEIMAEMGMIEVPDNMAPMEGVALIHEESSDITSALARHAYKQGMNVVWDSTMGSTGSVQKRIDELRENGYDEIVGTFTDVPLEVSVNGAAQRYAQGMDKFIGGNGYGGRYVPESVIRKAETETPGVTRNKQVFNSLRDQFDSWEIWDNNRYNDSGDRQPPLMVDSGAAPERNHNDRVRGLPSGQGNSRGSQGRSGAPAAGNDQTAGTVQAAGLDRSKVDSPVNLRGSDNRASDRGGQPGGSGRATSVNQRRAADMTEAERHAAIVEMNNRLLDGNIDAEEYERTVWDMEHPDGPDYDNRPTPAVNEGDALHQIVNPDARIQITHTEDEGTLVQGTERGDNLSATMRANGFKWSRNLKAWYAPRSRDKRPNSYKISRLHQALKDQGLDVGLDVDRRMGDAQRREDRRDQRSADRIAALGEKVQRKQAAANAAWNTHFNRVDELPPDGEPIKVGHHSEKRHRRALDNAWKSLGRAVDAGKAVEDAQYRMEAAERSRRSRNRPQTVANRIEKLEKQIKKSRDQLNGAPAYKGGAPRAPLTGDRRVRALNAIDADMQDLNLQRAIFEQLKADGKVVDIHDLNPGDKVKLYGEWVPVVKVNKTTASMANGWKLKQGEATVVKRATDAEREALDKAKKAQQKKSANGPHIVGEPIRKHHALTDGSETFNRGKITRNGFTIKSVKGVHDGAYGGMFEVTPPQDKKFYVAQPSALPRAKSLDEAREIIDRAAADLTIPEGRLSHNSFIGSPDSDLFKAVMRPHGDPMGYARDILRGREQQGRLTYPDMWQAVAYQNGDFLRMNFSELEALADGGGERAEAARKYLEGRFPGQFNLTKGNTAGALEFPELQLMSSAQLETIASGTGPKATAAQQLLNDRG